MEATHSYAILVPRETVQRAEELLIQLRQGGAQAGGRLRKLLREIHLETLSGPELLGLLFDTRQPQIFAESQVAGDGSDRTITELSLLGDLSIAMPVTIFDNGAHRDPQVHPSPFEGMLLFTSGALLDNGAGNTPADWPEVVGRNGEISLDGFLALYRRRLLPVFRTINAHAAKPRSALITIPGIGCGQFAGPFRGKLAPLLQEVLQRLLLDHGEEWPNIHAVHFDPYSHGGNHRETIHGIRFQVHPSNAAGNQPIPQLCPPSTFAAAGDDFSTCRLYSLVAWDHVSWPGNDFYGNARATDDGVKAAATDAMARVTGAEGRYDAHLAHYRPPAPFRSWKDVAHDRLANHGFRLWNPALVRLMASSRQEGGDVSHQTRASSGGSPAAGT